MSIKFEPVSCLEMIDIKSGYSHTETHCVVLYKWILNLFHRLCLVLMLLYALKQIIVKKNWRRISKSKSVVLTCWRKEAQFSTSINKKITLQQRKCVLSNKFVDLKLVKFFDQVSRQFEPRKMEFLPRILRWSDWFGRRGEVWISFDVQSDLFIEFEATTTWREKKWWMHWKWRTTKKWNKNVIFTYFFVRQP